MPAVFTCSNVLAVPVIRAFSANRLLGGVLVFDGIIRQMLSAHTNGSSVLNEEVNGGRVLAGRRTAYGFQYTIEPTDTIRLTVVTPGGVVQEAVRSNWSAEETLSFHSVRFGNDRDVALHEMRVYQRALSVAQMQEVHEELSTKWDTASL